MGCAAHKNCHEQALDEIQAYSRISVRRRGTMERQFFAQGDDCRTALRYGSLMKLQELPSIFAVCRFEPTSEIPAWVTNSRFFSITRTTDELSIVCEQPLVPIGVKSENDWRAFKVVGSLDFSLTGILASIAQPLAEAKISIFAISSFDTDFVLVKSADWVRAHEVLQTAKFTFI